LVRTDLLKGLVTRWSDLWDPRYAGKIGVPKSPRELISITLKSLNYPLNTADPAQLEAALAHLIKLKPSIRYVSIEPESALKPLLNGEVAILLGWNGEVLLAQEQNSAISYVLPKEGTILWGDNFVISAASPHKYTAELFINFLLRPEISAQIVQTYYYPCANETARQFIDPKLLNNPLVYPPVDYLSESDFYLPLSPEGQKLYDDIWVRFTAASQ
jgi:spermidine/putrescine-binding protein